MEQLNFPLLCAQDIECRVAQTGKRQTGAWCTLLLYKDARCDQRILDQTVGPFAWMRRHDFLNGNNYCTVSIKGPDGSWIDKMDVGTESNTEAVKGEASDAFKRACFNWGIGRELYTAPSIFIDLREGESYEQQGKVKVSASVSFSVGHIAYDEDRREITELAIIDKAGQIRFSWNKAKAEERQAATRDRIARAKEEKASKETAIRDLIGKVNAAQSRSELTAIWNGADSETQANHEFTEAVKAAASRFPKAS